MVPFGKRLGVCSGRELGRFGSDPCGLPAGCISDIVRAEFLVLLRAGKDHEQPLLFLYDPFPHDGHPAGCTGQSSLSRLLILLA